MSDISRRKFVTTAAAAGAGLTIVPRHVLGRGFQAPSDTVNIATVGVGGMGRSNTLALASQNIVAFCDIDDRLLEGTLKQIQGMAAKAPAQGQRPPQGRPGQRPPSKAQLAANERRARVDRMASLKRFADEQIPRLKRYRDYREMLDKQKDLDGIVVATPDHMHAAIATAAMDLGKHVYVQKPLCWSVEEARVLAKKAGANKKIVTQMGNQGHSSDGARTGYELIRSGAIGDVREVHVWTNRPLGFWPQGIPRPEPRGQDMRGTEGACGRSTRWASTPSPTLSWDLFSARAGVHYPVHPATGAAGPIGAGLRRHGRAPVDSVLALDPGPDTIETVSTRSTGLLPRFDHHYEFRRAAHATVKLMHDGGPPPNRRSWRRETNKEGGSRRQQGQGAPRQLWIEVADVPDSLKSVGDPPRRGPHHDQHE
jgi:hypothetical protein